MRVARSAPYKPQSLALTWRGSLAAAVSFAALAFDTGEAQAGRKKPRADDNPQGITYVYNTDQQKKVLELLAKPEWSEDDIQTLQGYLKKKRDGIWGPKSAGATYQFIRKTGVKGSDIQAHVAEKLAAYGYKIADIKLEKPVDVPSVLEGLKTLEGKLAAFVLDTLGQEAAGDEFPLTQHEALKKFFTDMGDLAAPANKYLSRLDKLSDEQKQYQETLKRFVTYADKSKGSENPYSGLPDALMEFFKEHRGLLYRARPAVLENLEKYDQGAELAEYRFDFTRYTLQPRGFDSYGLDHVLTPLTTVGDKIYPDDPYTRDVMEALGNYADTARALHKRHIADSEALVAGRVPDGVPYGSSRCRIVLDPGHGYVTNDGGYDPGAIREKISEITPDLERLYYGIALSLAGCDVHYTRFPGYTPPFSGKEKQDDYTVKANSLLARPALATLLGAQALLTDHYNSATRDSKSGEEIYCKANSPQSCAMAERMAVRLGGKAEPENTWKVIVHAPKGIITLYFERGYVTNSFDREMARVLGRDHSVARETAFKRAGIFLDEFTALPGQSILFRHNGPGNGAIMDAPRRLDF